MNNGYLKPIGSDVTFTKLTVYHTKEFTIRAFKKQLRGRLGFDINTDALKIYQLAFIHGSSNLQDRKGHPLNFERLEFLGDAIINMIVIEVIYKRYRSASIQEVSELKSQLNTRNNLNQIGKKMKLLELIQTGESAPKFGVDIHGNLLESLIGAVFIDQGFQKSKECYLNLLEKYSSIPLVLN